VNFLNIVSVRTFVKILWLSQNACCRLVIVINARWAHGEQQTCNVDAQTRRFGCSNTLFKCTVLVIRYGVLGVETHPVTVWLCSRHLGAG